ncbi:MAG: hypothetical protein EBU90_17265 [Proteobacteria bacterium]|nr:hypothetical protein [Pseudomonadota bacterium]
MHKHEEPLNLEIMYINKLEERLQDEKNLVESFLTEKRIFTFKQFREDAPANAIAATPGISVPEGKPLFGKKLQRRKSNA